MGARGLNGSPLIEGDLLILLVSGRQQGCLTAFDKKTGQEVWRSLNETTRHSSPIAITAGGKRQLIVWTETAATSLDPATGKPYWNYRFQAGWNAVATPVLGQDQLLFSGMMLQLAQDKPQATVLWPDSKAVGKWLLSATSSPLLRDGYVYSLKRSTGELVCLEAKTGKQVWATDKVANSPDPAGAAIHMVAIANGPRALLFTHQGELVSARLTPKGYEEISRTLLVDPIDVPMGVLVSGTRRSDNKGKQLVCWIHPAFANRHVFARNAKELICASLAGP